MLIACRRNLRDFAFRLGIKKLGIMAMELHSLPRQHSMGLRSCPQSHDQQRVQPDCEARDRLAPSVPRTASHQEADARARD